MSNDSAFDIALTSATTSPGIFPPAQQDIVYNAFDKVTSITEGDKSLQITYGHHRQRSRQQYTAAGSTTTKVYSGACEYITKNGQTTIHTYLSGPEGLFAIMVKEPNGTQYIRYIHTDHLGSWNTITDAGGNRLQEINFDAWGNRRDPNTWQIISNFSQPLLFDRGFTGHEHLTEFNLINMNGRVYDPTIMRFLSPDPFIQAPDYSQSFNRYSYVMNNPMNLTDKSGFYWEDYDVIPPGLGLDPEKDREFIEYLESSGFLLDQVEVVATRLDMSSDEFGTQFWLFHDGFGFDMEYDGYDPSGGGPGWEAYVGTAGDIAEEMYYSKTYGTWMGKDFKIYKQTWGGNGVTGGKNKFGKTTSNAIKWGGRALGAWNAYSIQRDYAAGEMGTGWMMAEQGTNTVSTFGGIYGAAWGLGWEMGRAITTLDAYQEFTFNFWYNRMENAIGPPSPINEGAWYDFFNNYGR